jgi:NAD-dependent DNA ligase
MFRFGVADVIAALGIDNIGNAEPKHVNSRTEDLNSLHFCPSEAINEIEIVQERLGAKVVFESVQI